MSYTRRSPLPAGGGVPLPTRLYSVAIAPPVILVLILLLAITELVVLVSRRSAGSPRPTVR